MKFTSIIVPTMLLAGVIAEPIPAEKRALSDYRNILNTVTAQIDVAANDLDDYLAGSVPGTVVQASSEVLVDLLEQAVIDIGPLAPLSVIDALQLITPITTLVNRVDDLTNVIISAEPNFIADGLEADVLAILLEFKAAGEDLQTVITPKVPAGLQSLANSLAAQVVADVDRAIAAYSD
ncbi:hydrophobic surface binding protein A-domain-containing protein [Aspergillus karnatakaensis]|uniref:cell wall mannoprotein 1 family protein n=1 Tax=Aspergillus karnatakaensis TaxID=1810916 RepID=UPI003CCE1569